MNLLLNCEIAKYIDLILNFEIYIQVLVFMSYFSQLFVTFSFLHIPPITYKEFKPIEINPNPHLPNKLNLLNFKLLIMK